jgi:hypothetical protein
MRTDSRPAQTSAVAVIGLILCRTKPIWVAATRNGSEVAGNSPIAAAARRPVSRTPSERGRVVYQAAQVQPYAAADEEDRDYEAGPAQ